MADTETPQADFRASQIADIRALTTTLLDRVQFARAAGITFKGDRDLYEVLGYDREIEAKRYRERYARGGIAARIVDAFPKATWRGTGELVEDEDPEKETTFEEAWFTLADRLKIWAMFQRTDLLAAQGRYAVLLLGAPGTLDSELPKTTKSESLLYLTPFAEEDAKIAEWDQDVASERFGLPKSYNLKRTNISSPELAKPVHWTRVVHIAENAIDNEVFGQPRLERVWNYLDDLDKVTGGGSEAFWLRANQGLQLDVDKDMDLGVEEKKNLKEQADEYQHQIRRMLRTRGVTVTTLGSDVANFSNQVDAILTLIAGTIGIPKRILSGSEMGELASGQDRDNWDSQVQDRRTGFAGPSIVRPFVDRLIKYGYLPTPEEYEVRWPGIENLTETEKAEGAKRWAEVNQAMGEKVFTSDEIRDKWYGMEPLEEDELDEPESIAIDPITGLPIAGFPKEDPEEEVIERLEAAIRGGKPIDLVVRGARR